MNDATFDPSQTYVCLAADGSARPVAGGEGFWSRPQDDLEQIGDGWLVSEFECTSDWANWEMHPEAEEFIYLLSGAAVLVLELPSALQQIALADRAAVVVPRGVWHTAKILVPSRMLFVTRGRGTEHRPVESDLGPATD